MNLYGGLETLRIYTKFLGWAVSEWQHGWQSVYSNRVADAIVGNDGLAHTRRDLKYFVARTDQAEALKDFGFPNAVATGLPPFMSRRRLPLVFPIVYR